MKTKAKRCVGKSKVGALDGGALLWRCAVVFLFSHYLAQAILLSLIGQESAEIIAQFCAYVVGIIVLQTVFCWAVFRWTARKKPSRGVSRWRFLFFAAVLTFNILGLFLSYTKFVGVATVLQVVILAALFAVLLEIFLRGNKALFVGLTLLGISANIELGVQVWQKLPVLFPDVAQTTNNWRDNFPARYQKIQFKTKPNIYLVSWDALIPSAIAEEYLQIAPGDLEYARYLNDGEFRVFKNVFIDRGSYPTQSRELDPTLYEGSIVFHNSLLILDPNLWERLSGPPRFNWNYKGRNYFGQFHYFNGLRPSPLFGIFQDNGYQIMTSYESEHMGVGGPYIDEYLTPMDTGGHCRFGVSVYYFQGLGFCAVWRLETVNWNEEYKKHKRRSSYREFGLQPFATDLHMNFIMPQLMRHAQSGDPWLNFMYINAPTHVRTPGYFHRAEEQAVYRKQLIDRSHDTVRYMKEVIELIRAHDTGAFILFFGDHGAQFTREIYNKRDMRDADKKRFHVLDLHAVMAAIYPKDACAEYMNFDTTYVTISMLLRRLVVCLAAGEDPIDWAVDYSSPYSDVNFEDYLYE